MNKRGFAIVLTAIIIGVIIGGGVIADKVLQDKFGLGLKDLFNIITSSKTMMNAPSINDVKDQIGIKTYNELISQKEELEGTLNAARSNLEVVNNNTDIVGILKAAFGENYTIYLFTTAQVGNLTFKVLEWSIDLTNGKVTTFTNGSIHDDYDVTVQASQAAAYKLLKGEVTAEDATNWVKNGELKIDPITEIAKFINALPQIMNLVQEHVTIN